MENLENVFIVLRHVKFIILYLITMFFSNSGFQCKEILNDSVSLKKHESLSSDYLNINEMLANMFSNASGENKRPNEKFNIEVTIECIRKKIAENDSTKNDSMNDSDQSSKKTNYEL